MKISSYGLVTLRLSPFLSWLTCSMFLLLSFIRPSNPHSTNFSFLFFLAITTLSMTPSSLLVIYRPFSSVGCHYFNKPRHSSLQDKLWSFICYWQLYLHRLKNWKRMIRWRREARNKLQLNYRLQSRILMKALCLKTPGLSNTNGTQIKHFTQATAG